MKIIKSNKIFILLVFLAIMGFTKPQQSNTVKIGTIAGPETALVEVAKDIAKKKYNLDVEIVQFTNYLQPNAALEEGSIDINMFQHLPFLEQQNKSRGYHIVAIAKTFIFPMALYSIKHKGLSDIVKGSIISIPNDPTNEGRALLLLQSAHLIELKKGVGYSAVPRDIVKNPHELRFMELDGPQLPRSLSDVDYSVINNTFAYTAGLNPKNDTVYTEAPDSPYANLIAVKAGHEHDSNLLKLVEALKSKEVIEKAKFLFNNQLLPSK